MHKEFVPEGNTVNVDFFKGVMDRLLKRIHRVRPAAFCSRDFFLLQDNAPAQKSGTFLPIFDRKKSYNPFSLPVPCRFISASLFSVPQVENEIIGCPICGCCCDPKTRTW